MLFTYDTLPISGKDQLREIILERFERDIATVSCSSGMRNFAFVFAEGAFPAVIRVGVEMPPHKTAADVLSELMLIDDLRNDVPTVCQPIPSCKNRLVEQVSVDETTYLVTMFRKANGAVLETAYWDEQYCYRVGALLGKIHRTSYESYTRGFRYKRKTWDQFPQFDFSCLQGYVSEKTLLIMKDIKQKIQSIPKDPRWYGIIHGDFINTNIYNDWDTVWVFDFDDSCYGYFMFDIATFFQTICLMNTQSSTYPKNFEAFIYGPKGVYNQFRKGYESEWTLPEEQWELFDDFFRLRLAEVDGIFVVSKSAPPCVAKAIIDGSTAYFEPGDRPILRASEVSKRISAMLSPVENSILLMQ